MGELTKIEELLTQLDQAYDDLRAARERLEHLLPLTATQPGDSGRMVHFVTGLDKESEQDAADENLRRISAAAWEDAQRALAVAQEKVQAANREIRRRLAEG